MSVAGAPVSPSGIAAAGVSTAAGSDAEEMAWRQRNAGARAELAEARAALGQAEATLPIVNIGTRPNAANVILKQMRDSTLLPYRAREAEAKAKVDELPEAARKAGAAPGWVR